jgi:4-carboxymuconolactone decarboxylase
MTQLPGDIDPHSRCRLPLPARPDDGEAQKLYDAHSKPNAHSIRGLHGPAGIYLHSPELAAKRRAAGRYLRFEADLSPHIREVAILVTARSCLCAFEWAAHEHEARSHGVSEATIEAIRTEGGLDDIDHDDALIIKLGRAIFKEHKVEPALYAQCHALLGTKNMVDLVALMGSYASTAALLIAFDMQLDEGINDPF